MGNITGSQTRLINMPAEVITYGTRVTLGHGDEAVKGCIVEGFSAYGPGYLNLEYQVSFFRNGEMCRYNVEPGHLTVEV